MVYRLFFLSDKTGKESNRKDLLAEYDLLQHLGQHANVVLVLGGVTITGVDMGCLK